MLSQFDEHLQTTAKKVIMDGTMHGETLRLITQDSRCCSTGMTHPHGDEGLGTEPIPNVLFGQDVFGLVIARSGRVEIRIA